MRVAVIIPTTQGPAPILKLTQLVHAPRSVLRTQDDYRPLPPSSRYHAFIQPGGPLAERIGLVNTQFEMRLGAQVETGRSWELPVAIAHWLVAKGHQLDAEAPDLVVWATGALDNDLCVLQQSYHLETKLDHSSEMLETWFNKGVPILALLPQSMPPERPPERYSANYKKVVDFEASISAISRLISEARQAPPVRGGTPPSWRSGIFGAGLASVTTIALVWFVDAAAMFGRTAPSGQAIPSAQADMGIEAPLLDAETPESALPFDEASQRREASTTPLQIINREATDLIAEAELEVGNPTSAIDSDIEGLAKGLQSTLPALLLAYAPDSSNCRAVLFGSVEASLEVYLAGEDGYWAVPQGDLCWFGFSLPAGTPDAQEVMLPQSLLELVIASDRRQRFQLSPGDTSVFRLRNDIPASLEAEITITPTGAGAQTLARVILASQP